MVSSVRLFVRLSVRQSPLSAKSKEESLSVTGVCLCVELSCVSSYRADAVDRLLIHKGLTARVSSRPVAKMAFRRPRPAGTRQYIVEGPILEKRLIW